MAEDDWYGPFAGLNKWHGYAFTGLLAGALDVVAGFIGYDLGKRTWIVGGPPPPTRWMGETL
jgi:hypothetical protein